MLLLTGLRNEDAALRWEHVDLIDGTLHIPETKNRRPLTLPLSDGLRDMLTHRLNDAARTGSPYVFPSTARQSYFTSALTACHRVAEAADAGAWRTIYGGPSSPSPKASISPPTPSRPWSTTTLAPTSLKGICKSMWSGYGTDATDYRFHLESRWREGNRALWWRFPRATVDRTQFA
ncbi:MAG: tyrosine-type recombinase/integrase [Candidatus Competibacteraceae bacterium]